MITIDSIAVGDEPAAWSAAGFSVDRAVTQLGTVRIELVGKADGRGIRGWTLRGAADGAFDGSIDGLPTARDGEKVHAVEAAPVQPNGTTSIDHVVVATPNFSRTITALDAAGFALRRERESGTYGAPMRQAFFRAGEVIIEVVGAPGQNGDGDAVFYGLALTVADLDATAMFLGDALGNIKDAVQPGRRIATLRHRQVHLSTAIAFMSPEVPATG